MKICGVPVRSEAKAIIEPSGEKQGDSLFPGAVMTVRCDVTVSMVAIWNLPPTLVVQAMRVPSWVQVASS